MAFVFSNEARAILTATLEVGATSAEIDTDGAATFASPTGGNLQRCILRDDTDDYEIVDISANDLTGAITLVRARESTSQKEWAPGSILEQYLSKAVLESLQ